MKERRKISALGKDGWEAGDGNEKGWKKIAGKIRGKMKMRKWKGEIRTEEKEEF